MRWAMGGRGVDRGRNWLRGVEGWGGWDAGCGGKSWVGGFSCVCGVEATRNRRIILEGKRDFDNTDETASRPCTATVSRIPKPLRPESIWSGGPVRIFGVLGILFVLARIAHVFFFSFSSFNFPYHVIALGNS